MSVWSDRPEQQSFACSRFARSRGADDGESLYHSTEHADLACLRLLLDSAHRRSPQTRSIMLDREDIDGLWLLLAAGANPNHLNQRGETSLHWAVWRGRSAKTIALLLDADVNPDVRRKDGRTAYALAVQNGQTAAAKLLESHGANTDLSALDRFVGACAAADPADLDRLLAESRGMKLPEEYHRLLPDLASSRRTSAVRALLAAGVPPKTLGEHGGAALHWACWKGLSGLGGNPHRPPSIVDDRRRDVSRPADRLVLTRTAELH